MFPPPPQSLFENEMGNPFFGMSFFGTKRSTKEIQNSQYKAFHQKNAFGLILDLGKYPNQKTYEIRKYMYMHVFWFGHIPSSRIKSKSFFVIRCYIISVLNFFVERFGPQNGVQKNNFLLYFQKVIWVGGKFFLPKFFSEQAKHPQICPIFSGNMVET